MKKLILFLRDCLVWRLKKDKTQVKRKAMAQAIHKAMNNEPSIDWLLENQDKITHKYYQRGLNGEL